MENSSFTNWQSFKEQLLANPTLDLQFQYAPGKWVAPSYHITEIKQAPIVSVDCGGKMNSWTEIIMQLWEPVDMPEDRAMKVIKALSIIELVEKSLPLNPHGTVKIEFGNSQFDTRQMFPGTISSDGKNLIVDLQPDFTQCKAINRGGTCGTTENAEECCTPVAKKPKTELKNLASSAVGCEAGSGCC